MDAKLKKTFHLLFIALACEKVASTIVLAPLIITLTQHLTLAVGHSFLILNSLGLTFTMVALFVGICSERYATSHFSYRMSLALLFIGLILLHSTREYLPLIYLALTTIVSGSLLFTINVYRGVSHIIRKHDELSDSLFAGFHRALLIGSMIGTLLAGIADLPYYSIALAFILISALTYTVMPKQLFDQDKHDKVLPFMLGISLVVALMLGYMMFPRIWLLALFVLLIAAGYLYAYKQKVITPAIFSILLLMMTVATLLRLNEGYLLLFVHHCVNTTYPAVWLLLVQAIMTLVIVSVLSRIWRVYGRSKPYTKLACGFLFMAISFIILVLAPGINQIPLYSLFAYALFMSLSEAYLLPVTISAFNQQLSSEAITLSYALFLSTVGLGKFNSAFIGQLFTPQHSVHALANYRGVFLGLFFVCMILVCICITLKIKERFDI